MTCCGQPPELPHVLQCAIINVINRLRAPFPFRIALIHALDAGAARPLRNPRSMAYCSLCHVSGRCQLAPQPTTQDAAITPPHGTDSDGHHGPALSSLDTFGFRLRGLAHLRDRGQERRPAQRSLHHRGPCACRKRISLADLKALGWQWHREATRRIVATERAVASALTSLQGSAFGSHLRQCHSVRTVAGVAGGR